MRSTAPPIPSRDTLRYRAWVRAALLTFLVVGCGAKGPNTPPVEQVRAGLTEKSPSRVLSVAEKKRRAEIKQMWKATADERKQHAGDLRSATVEHLSEAEFKNGHIRMVREDGGWMISTPLLAVSSEESPRQALRILLTAIRNGDAAQIASLLSERRATEFSDMLQGFFDGLTQDLDGAFVSVQGDSATVRWTNNGLHFRVSLVLEAGFWRLDDIHIYRLDPH